MGKSAWKWRLISWKGLRLNCCVGTLAVMARNADESDSATCRGMTMLQEPGPHEVLVRWVANGVCHSDLHVMTGDYPHPLPVVLGHEAAGVVEKVGPGVESVAPGDHVCSSYIPSCGKCWYCIGGQPTMCALRDKPRWFMLDGGAL